MKTNQEIHITTDGKTTYAVLKQNGKVLSRSEAKCHPDDKFDFETGAKIALDRLEIKKEVDEPKNPFKPGDIVECIFDFKTFGAFPPKGTMGKVISITRQGVLVRWAKGSTYGNGEWWISACDIRKIDQHEEPFKVGDRVRFRSWDDMESEFGVDPKTGSINIRGKIYFDKYMRPLCKTYATIESIRVCRDGLLRVELSKSSSNEDVFNYSSFSTDMLEPASTKGYKS